MRLVLTQSVSSVHNTDCLAEFGLDEWDDLGWFFHH